MRETLPIIAVNIEILINASKPLKYYIMKKITTLLLILLTMPLYPQWVQQNSGVDKALNDVYCITQNNVFIVGNNGTILKTTDGGTNWIQKNSGTTQDLMKVQFINSNVGFAFGAFGTLLKTIDGGESWNSIDTGGTTNCYYCRGLSCVNENVFYISCALWFKKTTNGGITFETVNAPISQNIEDIQFLTEQIGYAKGPDKLYKTIDGGNTWTVILDNYYSGAFFFLNQNIGFVYANGNYKTIDGGLNFSIIEYPNESMLQAVDIFSLNENIIWQVDGLFLLCGCPAEYCLTKINQLESPENQVINNCDLGDGFDSVLNAIHFANDTNGYAVGHLSYTGDMGPPLSIGAIFKNSTGTMLAANKVNKKEEIILYPNPASDNIIVSLAENSKNSFYVEITNCLGEIIFSKFYQADNSAKINVESFSKGIYFLTVNSHEKRTTQKVIIK